MTDDQLESKILQHVTQESYQPAKPRLIARRLGLTADDMPSVRQAIKQLVRRGRLLFGARHQVLPAQKTLSDERIGRFERVAGGYGFVRPHERRVAGQREADIFVPASRTRDAATGDTVLVRLRPRQHGRHLGLSGEVIKIISRRTHQFVGTYFEMYHKGYVRVDGTAFPDAIYVGDPNAKGARHDDRVVVEMVRFPSQNHEGEAVITEVLGDRNRPGVDTLTIYREFDLPGEFPESVQQEARDVADKFTEKISVQREDLTSLTTITIDPVDARDFDDAISLQKSGRHTWTLGVHIADVAHFVPEGSKLDQEARDRATSIYLPDRVIPMLPEQISNHLASLQPDRVRYSRTVFIEYSDDGVRHSVRVCRSAIRSCRRFSYEEVDDYLARPDAWRQRLTPQVRELLTDMHELAMQLRRRRMANGALQLNMPETKLDLDDDGKVRSARQEIQTVSHQIIEEFMLAANMAVAEHLRDQGQLFLRRVHDDPSPRKIQGLEKFVRHLGLAEGGLQDRFQIKQLLAKVAEGPLEQVVNLSVLRSLPKATYSAEPAGHFALSSDCYCHFTSPIRRYPDLTIHRLLDLTSEKSRRRRQPQSSAEPTEVELLAEHCSEREQRAEQAERELIRLKLLRYFEERVGQPFTATVTGIATYGVFVQCTPIPGEGLIAREHLRDDRYEYDSTREMLVGQSHKNDFRLGDTVEVEVARVDLIRREIDFQYVRHIRSPHRRIAPKKGHATGKPSPRARGKGKSRVKKGKSARASRRKK